LASGAALPKIWEQHLGDHQGLLRRSVGPDGRPGDQEVSRQAGRRRRIHLRQRVHRVPVRAAGRRRRAGPLRHPPLTMAADRTDPRPASGEGARSGRRSGAHSLSSLTLAKEGNRDHGTSLPADVRPQRRTRRPRSRGRAVGPDAWPWRAATARPWAGPRCPTPPTAVSSARRSWRT